MFIHLFIGLLLLFAGEKSVVAPERIEKTVCTYLESSLQVKYPEVAVDFRSAVREVVLPAGDYTVAVAPSFGIPSKGYAAVPVEILKEGRLMKTIVCSVIIRTYENVYLASQAIPKNTVVSREYFQKKRMETTLLNDDLVFDLATVEKYRTKRIVNENTVLTMSVLEEIPLVAPNEPVTVIVSANNVNVETTGIAKEEGKMGEMIKIKRNGSREFVYGKVIGDRRVEIVVR